MTRQWVPGDVAILPNGKRAIVNRRGEFVYGSGERAWAKSDSLNGRHARPLVVIDPDSPEDQRRLLSLLRNSGAFRGVVSGGVALDCIGDALHEFADPKPVKPAEPTGLGAVVEDANGVLWVRDAERHDRWFSAPANAVSRRQPWADTDAVRVLSEGVTP